MDNLSKYLEDISFISWVFEPSVQLDLHWKQFEEGHPEESANMRMARKIVLQFRAVAHPLSEEEKIILFSRVLNQIEQKQQTRKTYSRLLGFARYAAVAVLFFSIGALLFYRQTTNNQALYTFNQDIQVAGNQAQLIRSNGENVILEDQKSVIKYQKSGELVINKDTIKPPGADSKNQLALNQLIIPYGKTSEVLLPDGTKVFLNAGSRLAYPDHFSGNSREVLLVGEAYFEVQHDPEIPFIVQANGLIIKDLGTMFNICAYPNDGRIETLLAEGKVSITQNNAGIFSKATELTPGQLASFNTQTSNMTVQSVNVADYILWTQGMMKFEATDLSRILKKLERYYNIHFQFEDPMLGTLAISGKLELSEDKNEVIERITRTASVKIVKKGDNYYEILK